MKKILFLIFILFSTEVNAAIVAKGSPSCGDPANLDIITAAILTKNTEIGLYMLRNEGCIIFMKDTKVVGIESYGSDRMLIKAKDYYGYVYKVDLK